MDSFKDRILGRLKPGADWVSVSAVSFVPPLPDAGVLIRLHPVGPGSEPVEVAVRTSAGELRVRSSAKDPTPVKLAHQNEKLELKVVSGKQEVDVEAAGYFDGLR